MYHVDDVPQAAGSFGDLPRKKEASRQNYVTAPPVFANALLDQEAVEQEYCCRRRLLLSREVPDVRRVGTGRRGVEDLGRFEVERYCYSRVHTKTTLKSGQDPLKRDDRKGGSSTFFALLIDFPPCDNSKRDLTWASVPKVFDHWISMFS